MTNFKNVLLLCILGSLLLLGCKKKKDTVEPIVTAPIVIPTLSGYYIKANINGSLVETIDGQNNYTISDATTSGSAGGSAINASYNCSFQQLSVSNEKYFQLSFSDNYFADGNDSDELQTICSVGSKNLVDGISPYYSLYYIDENGKQYQPDPTAASIAIQIETVTDLGKQSISQLFGGSSNKRVVKLTGKITSARLYEYSFISGFTSNYVDVSNLDFIIRYILAVDMP